MTFFYTVESMPRVTVEIPVSLLYRADLAALSLTSDGMITRLRDVVMHSKEVAIAIARVIAQLVYRLASERYVIKDDKAYIVIELTKDELGALNAWHDRILDDINVAITHYESLLEHGTVRNKTAVEQRIASLTIWKTIIEQLAKAFEEKRYSWRSPLKEG